MTADCLARRLSSGKTGPQTGSLKNAVVKAAVMASMSAAVACRAATGPEALLIRPMVVAAVREPVSLPGCPAVTDRQAGGYAMPVPATGHRDHAPAHHGKAQRNSV